MKGLLKCKVIVKEVNPVRTKKETNTHIELFSRKTQVQEGTKMQNQKQSNIVSYRNHDESEWPHLHHRHQDLLTRVYKELLLCVFRLQQNCLSCCCCWWWCQVAFARRGEQKSGDDEDSAGHDDDDGDDVSITKSIFLRHPHCLKHHRKRGWFLPKK